VFRLERCFPLRVGEPFELGLLDFLHTRAVLLDAGVNFVQFEMAIVEDGLDRLSEVWIPCEDTANAALGVRKFVS
jgi:hypothetical protein